MAEVFNWPFGKATNNLNLPVAGAKLFFYLTGTKTLTEVWADSEMSIPSANPAIADASGSFSSLYLNPSITYRVRLETPTGGLLGDADPIQTGSVAVAKGYSLSSKSDGAFEDIPSNVMSVRTDGYYEAGDGGEALYVRVLNGVATGLSGFRSIDRYTPDGTYDEVEGGYWGYASSGPIRPEQVGAYGNGTNDDTLYIKEALSVAAKSGKVLPGLPGGGIVSITKTYRITDQVIVPKWTSLIGDSFHGELVGWNGTQNKDKTDTRMGANKGTLICSPTGKLTLSDSTRLQYLNIISDRAATNPPSDGTAATVAATKMWLNGFGNFPVAIDVLYAASGFQIGDCLIAGFALAFKAVYNYQFHFFRNSVDCINGMFISDVYDDIRIRDNHFWPFTVTHRFAGGVDDTSILQEYGTYIKFSCNYAGGADRSIDGGHVSGNLFYGAKIAVDCDATNTTIFTDNGIDNDSARSDNADTIGFRFLGNCRRTKLIGNHSGAVGRAYDLGHSSVITFDSNSAAGCSVSGIRFGPYAAVSGSTFLFQDRIAQPMEISNGAGPINFNTLWFDIPTAGQACNLPDAATRNKINWGEIVVNNPNPSFNPIDPRDYTTYIEATGSGTQTFAPNVSALASFNVVNKDGIEEFTGGTTFLAKASGDYDIEVGLLLQPTDSTPGLIRLQLLINGTTPLLLYNFTAGAAVPTGIYGSRTISLAQGSSITAEVLLERGGTSIKTSSSFHVRRAKYP